jgi:hydroxymethylbilane synthase
VTIRIGTRASKLALTQTQQTADQLAAVGGFPVELVHIRTDGDVLTGSLSQMGGTGVFVAALRDALLRDACDVAVHSLKDLPTGAALGLNLAATPKRVDVRDVLCARDGLTLAQLPAGATVGTGSPRRAAQLRAARPDLDIRDIRGNVDTRLGRVAPGDLDAVVLARAGLSRLDRVDAITETLDPLQVLPAPAQGALAVECRTSDARTRELLGRLEEPTVRACVIAERSTLAALEAGCSAPVAAYAEVADGENGPELFLRASVTAIDGSDAVRGSATGPLLEAAALGRALATELLDRGAAELMAVGS